MRVLFRSYCTVLLQPPPHCKIHSPDVKPGRTLSTGSTTPSLRVELIMATCLPRNLSASFISIRASVSSGNEFAKAGWSTVYPAPPVSIRNDTWPLTHPHSSAVTVPDHLAHKTP